MFFTIWYGVFNTKSRVLKYSSAGHHAALLLENGRDHKLSASNCIIGLLPDFRFESEEIQVPENSRLFVFSDGAFEIMKKDGEMWDIENLYDYLVSYNHGETDEIDILYNYSLEISAEHKFNDDYSMLKISFL